jgi:hypothetical protein
VVVSVTSVLFSGEISPFAGEEPCFNRMLAAGREPGVAKKRMLRQRKNRGIVFQNALGTAMALCLRLFVVQSFRFF